MELSKKDRDSLITYLRLLDMAEGIHKVMDQLPEDMQVYFTQLLDENLPTWKETFSQRAQQKQALKELMQLSEELGLYDNL